jgi:hypothetical protein
LDALILSNSLYVGASKTTDRETVPTTTLSQITC